MAKTEAWIFLYAVCRRLAETEPLHTSRSGKSDFKDYCGAMDAGGKKSEYGNEYEEKDFN